MQIYIYIYQRIFTDLFIYTYFLNSSESFSCVAGWHSIICEEAGAQFDRSTASPHAPPAEDCHVITWEVMTKGRLSCHNMRSRDKGFQYLVKTKKPHGNVFYILLLASSVQRQLTYLACKRTFCPHHAPWPAPWPTLLIFTLGRSPLPWWPHLVIIVLEWSMDCSTTVLKKNIPSLLAHGG